jgi:predicted dehydrogenase
MTDEGKVVVLEGCLGDWSKKSYIKSLAEKAESSKIKLYAVDIRDLKKNEDLKELYEGPVKFINKIAAPDEYKNIEPVDYVFVVAPPAVHCEIAEYWLINGKLKENGRVFIEKPLDSSEGNIKKLEQKLKEGGHPEYTDKILVIDHYIEKISPILIKLEEIRQNSRGKTSSLGEIRAIECNILESDPIQDSRLATLSEGLILDMVPHVLAILSRTMQALGRKFELNIEKVEIFDINAGKHKSAKIENETFAEIVCKINGIPLKTSVGKAVGYTNRKDMKIFFESGVLFVDFVSNSYFIEERSEREGIITIRGELSKTPIEALLKLILDNKKLVLDYEKLILDYEKLNPAMFLTFDEGFKVVSVISKIRKKVRHPVHYSSFSSPHQILPRSKLDKRDEMFLDVLLKQYELLRSEIIQSIYLEHAAILGLYTFLGLTIAALISRGTADLEGPILPLILLFAQVIVNGFGSLFLMEQSRNRRACSFEKAIERLINKKLGEIGVYWEHYIVSRLIRGKKSLREYIASDIPINKQYYKNRLLSVGLPIYLPNFLITSLLCLLTFGTHGMGGLIFVALVLTFFLSIFNSKYSLNLLLLFVILATSLVLHPFSGGESPILLGLLSISALMTLLWGLVIMHKTFSPLDKERIPNIDQISSWLEEEEEILNIQKALQNK